MKDTIEELKSHVNSFEKHVDDLATEVTTKLIDKRFEKYEGVANNFK